MTGDMTFTLTPEGYGVTAKIRFLRQEALQRFREWLAKERRQVRFKADYDFVIDEPEAWKIKKRMIFNWPKQVVIYQKQQKRRRWSNDPD